MFTSAWSGSLRATAGLALAALLRLSSCGPTCAAGSQNPCTCTDGRSGSQVCRADGSGYDQCVCTGGGDDAGPTDDAVCTGVCNPGVCGPNTNGCGGSCDCPSGQSCVANQCQCTPNCGGKNCGGDGCGGGCGTCTSLQMCSSAGICVEPACVPDCHPGFDCVSGECQLKPSSIWAATVDRGTVAQNDCNGATWDALGGLPDPQFCMNTNGTLLCTTAVDNTLTPVWPNGPFPNAFASTYMAGIPIQYLDVDTGTANDTICSGQFVFTLQDFQAGSVTITCPCPDGSTSATAHIILTPR